MTKYVDRKYSKLRIFSESELQWIQIVHEFMNQLDGKMPEGFYSIPFGEKAFGRHHPKMGEENFVKLIFLADSLMIYGYFGPGFHEKELPYIDPDSFDPDVVIDLVRKAFVNELKYRAPDGSLDVEYKKHDRRN